MKLIKQCFKPLYRTTKYHIDDNMILYKMKVLLQCFVTKKTKRSTTHVRKRTSTEIKFSHYKAFLYLLLHILSGWLLYRNICFLMLDIKRLIKFINILPTKSYWKRKICVTFTRIPFSFWEFFCVINSRRYGIEGKTIYFIYILSDP